MTDFEPKQFGKYVLLEKLAVGGMAEIYKAKTYGAEGFEKLLAIKRILPHAAEDKEFINMLIDEAKLSVLLSHANIVQVFDLGKTENDYFISMEFIHGINLRDILYRLREKEKKLPIELAVYVASEVSKGLDYAHRKADSNNQPLGIVHRDVSPQNILISYEGEVKIVDFGIAKAALNISHTMAGILKGKIAYMSPEQAMGKNVDGRTDIFSLGIVLYESLTGKKLFTGESQFEVLKKIRTSRIDVSKLPPSIPAPLKTILARALAYNQEERYTSAGDVQVALTKYLYATYTDFSPRKLAVFVKEVFADELKREKTKKDQEMMESKTGSISLATGKKHETIVHRETESSKGKEETHPATLREETSPPRKRRAALWSGLSLVLAAGIGWAVWKWALAPVPPSPPVAASAGTLHVRSNPPGAEIYLDGAPTAYQTPAILDNLVLKKKYTVGLVLENYGRLEKDIVLENQDPLFLNMTLSKLEAVKPMEPEGQAEKILFGSLLIETDPSGAKIFLDTEETGKVTPTKLEDLKVGENYVLRLQKEGHQPIEKKIEFKGVQTLPIREKLTPLALPPPPPQPKEEVKPKEPEKPKMVEKPAPKPTPKPELRPEPKKEDKPASGYANIRFSSTPSGADVFINGEHKGITPATMRIPAGSVKVAVTKGGDLLPCRRDFNIRAGQTEDFNCKLGPLFGRIDIQSFPPRASVFFNGQKMQGQTPMIIKKVQRDRAHTLRIELHGYKPWVRAFDLKESENKSFNVELEKG